MCPPTNQSQPQLLPGSLMPAPAPHTEVTESLTERREPETHASTPVRARCVTRSYPPAIPCTHIMALCPSSIPQCVALPSPPASFVPNIPDPESDLARAASSSVTRLLSTVVTDPEFESTPAFSLVTELVNFAARSCLDYVASLDTESEYVCPPSVGGEPAFGCDVLEDRHFELKCLATGLSRFASMLLCPEGDPDALDIPTSRSYAQAIAAQRDYELHSLDFSTAFLQGSLHEEIYLCRPPGFTGLFPAGTQWSLQRPVYGLRQAPREWNDTPRTTLAALGFAPSSADPSLFLCTDTTLTPFCVLVLQRFGFQYSLPQPTPLPTGHSLSAPPSDESVEPSGPYPELVGCLMYLMTCTRPDLAYPLSLLARYVAPGRHRKFYHPTSRRVLPSQDATFDESVPFYRLFPYRSAPPSPAPLFLAPGPPPVAVVSGAAPGTASGGVASRGAELGGAGSEGAGSGGAEPEGVEPGGAESEGAEPGGAESEGAESGGAEPRGAASSGGPAGASPRLSSQQLREWLVQRAHCRSGAPGAGEPGDTGARGAAVTTRAGNPTEPGAAGAGGAGAGVAGVGGPGAGGAGAAGAGAVDPGAGGAGGTVRLRPYFVPLLQQVLGVSSSTGRPPPFLCPPPNQSQPPLQPASPLPVPSPYTEQSGGLTERREPASRPVLPVRTARRAPRSRPPPVPGTHTMALRPSSVQLRVPLPAPSESSLPEVPGLESNRARAASPTLARLLATAVTELLDFAAARRLDYASALVAESVPASPPSVGGECALGTDVLEERQEDFECLTAVVPRFASLLLALEGDPDAPYIPNPRSYAEAITAGIYVDEVPPPGANIVDGMWIFRVKRPPGSPPAFKARYVARGFSQQHGVDYFLTFSPTPKMTTLQLLLHVTAQRDYELHSLDFSTAFLQGSLHEEIWLRRPPGITGTTTLAALGFAPSTANPSLVLRTDTSLPPFYILVYVDDLVFATADTEALTLVKSELQKRHTCTYLGELRSYLGLQISRDKVRRTITLTQSQMVHQVLQRFGFQYSSPQLTPLSTSHSLSAPPSDECVEPSGPYLELVGCLRYLMTCTRPDLVYPLSLLACYVAPGGHRKVHWDAAKRVLRYLCSTSGMGLVLGGRGPVVLTGHADASWVDDSATQRSSQGYTFSLGSVSVSWRSTRSSSVLSSSCEAEIYAGAMAAQEVRWLTYLLTDLGEQPRSPPFLYVDNKAMIALC
ncbi:unnamed protein product [Closterium sp. NIES-54]